jgi:hypothetical protein
MANLMDPMSIKVNLKAVANTIKESDESAAQRLEELSLAVGGGSNADAWASCDVYQMIEPENVIKRYKDLHVTNTFHSWLEWGRNILIFAPLVVTWLGVSQAVERYNQYINANPDQSIQPFLLLWQQGFGNTLPGILKLSSLAFIDFILLMTVLVLTVAAHSMSNTVIQQREKEAEDLRCQLTHALSGAALLLRTRNWQQPTNMLTHFDQVTQQFDSTITKLLDQIAALADRQQQELHTFADFKNDLSNSMIAVASSARDMKNSTTMLQQEVAKLVTPAQMLASQQGVMLTSAQEAVALLKNQIAAQDMVVKEQQRWGTELTNVLNTLSDTVNQGKIIASDIDEFTRRQSGLVTAMERERKEVVQTANNVYIATESLKHVVAEIHHCVGELNGVNVQMNELVRRIASMMRH